VSSNARVSASAARGQRAQCVSHPAARVREAAWDSAHRH